MSYRARGAGDAFIAGAFGDVLDLLDGSTAASLCNRAVASLELELYRACIRECDAAIRLDPACLRAYHLKGLALTRMGKSGEAEPCWRAGIEAGRATPVADLWILRDLLTALNATDVTPEGVSIRGYLGPRSMGTCTAGC